MKKLTKARAIAFITAHAKSNDKYLWHCYKNYSRAKDKAFDYCYDLHLEKNGFDFKIISYNTTQFTIGFFYEDATTGELIFVVITKDYQYYYPVDIDMLPLI